MKLPDHGANPQRLFEQVDMEMPERMIDFSENVHPFGTPPFLADTWQAMQALVSRYPDPEAEPFKSAAARYHGLEKDCVAAGNGAAEIFTWLARRYREKRVVLIEPAFSEYRKTLQAENAEIAAVQLTAENGWRLPVEQVAAAVQDCAALYICNPHNPTGLLVEKEVLLLLAETCRRAGCELVVDEAFIDFAGEEFSIIPHLADYPNLIIVRSMTKMYAIPGLRLGYVLAAPRFLKELTQGAAHWNVNALSAAIGAKCFDEWQYRAAITEAAAKERLLMTDFLLEESFEVTPSAVNFLSFRLPKFADPAEFFRDMLAIGMVLRHTKSFTGMDGEWFRIGMKSAAQMEELREAMAKWLKGE